jgi:hypothetical protein
MSALTNEILRRHPDVYGRALHAVDMVTVRGEITRTDDPRWSPEHNQRITKKVSVDDLPLTVIRWLALGRKITSIVAA